MSSNPSAVKPSTSAMAVVLASGAVAPEGCGGAVAPEGCGGALRRRDFRLSSSRKGLEAPWLSPSQCLGANRVSDAGNTRSTAAYSPCPLVILMIRSRR